MISTLKAAYRYFRLPAEARRAVSKDRRGLPEQDPGIETVIEQATRWLGRAQDNSTFQDGGVARHYSVVTGWAPSYPETTGYIIPTMLRLALHLDDPVQRERAQRMLEWLTSIQFDDGGFQGGLVNDEPRVPVTFNTGQILIGLAAGVRAFDKYHSAMHGAASFLRDSLDADGAWRRHPSPFAVSGDKAYETHVSWGLFEAESVAPGHGYRDAGLRQVDWALTSQHPNGWVENCCLQLPMAPLTHTLGYFLRGVVEAHRASGEDQYLDAAIRSADGLRTAQHADGFLPGRLNPDWSAAANWACLTGISQIAESWLYLYKQTGKTDYRDSAISGNRFVRRTVSIDGPPEIRGGVKGSFPIDGGYGRFQHLNWAAKFTIDANLAELDLTRK